MKRTGMNTLNGKQRRIVSIAANSAIGNVDVLTHELDAGLENELTEAEVKDIIMQIYSHCGFPLTLQSIVVFESVLEKRFTEGIDSPSKLSVIRNMDEFICMQYGKESRGIAATLRNICDSNYLEKHGYAYSPDGNALSMQERALVNISVLAATAGAETLLLNHIHIGLNMGLDIGVISDVMFIIGDLCPQRERIASDVLLRAVNHKTI